MKTASLGYTLTEILHVVVVLGALGAAHSIGKVQGVSMPLLWGGLLIGLIIGVLGIVASFKILKHITQRNASESVLTAALIAMLIINIAAPYGAAVLTWRAF